MKSVTNLALVLAISGLAATSAWADTGSAPVRSGSPSLLPLPEFSSSWNSGDGTAVVLSPSNVMPASADLPMASVARYEPPVVGAVGAPAPPMGDAAVPGCGTEGDCGCGESCGCGCWYGYGGGVIMTRNQPNKFWTTYNQANNSDQVLNTEQARAGWEGGPEATIGYHPCCGCGIEATYWGLPALKGFASITDGNNNLGTPMDTTNGGLTLGGQTADSFYANAHEALIWRNDQVNNFEVNWTCDPWAGDNCCCLHATFLAGVRFMNFDENLLWTSVAGGFNYGDNGGADQANLNIHTENDMVGFQIGSVVNWRICDRLSFFGVPKMGIYGNRAETEAHWYRGDGVNGFDITGVKDTVSFVGSLDLGLKYDLGCRWSLIGGYRVVVATGVALADNQIPHFLAAANEFSDVKLNGEVVLHGGFAGLSYCW